MFVGKTTLNDCTQAKAAGHDFVANTRQNGR
jgi:hypothetical protein